MLSISNRIEWNLQSRDPTKRSIEVIHYGRDTTFGQTLFLFGQVRMPGGIIHRLHDQQVTVLKLKAFLSHIRIVIRIMSKNNGFFSMSLRVMLPNFIYVGPLFSSYSVNKQTDRQTNDPDHVQNVMGSL